MDFLSASKLKNSERFVMNFNIFDPNKILLVFEN